MFAVPVTEGHDFAHQSAALGRQKIAHVVPPVAGSLGDCPLFILLHSFAGDRFSWIKNAPGVVSALAQDSLVILPECGRRWFIDDDSGASYETYLIEDLVPLVRTEYASAGPLSIGGFSMGGAAAFFLAFRHPDRFDSALAAAGAFFAPDREGDPYDSVRSDGLMMPTVKEHERVWGPPGSAVRARYDPAAMVEQLGRRAEAPRFYFEVGTDDFPRVVQASEQMRDLFDNAGIAYDFCRHGGDHSWDYAAKAMARLVDRSRRGP
jgi:putative tributyrin esterase